MFGISIQDYIPTQMINQTIANVKCAIMLATIMGTITMVFATYWIVGSAVNLPTWIAIWIAAAMFSYWSTRPTKTPVPNKLCTEDFVIISKEIAIATELSKLLPECKFETMEVAKSIIPVWEHETLINQVD
jgi:hypothetical protein